MNGFRSNSLTKIFFRNNDHALCFACDHGLMTDPAKSWLSINQTVATAMKLNVDGLLLSGGQARKFTRKYPKDSLPTIIVRTDWTNLLRVTERHDWGNKFLPVDQMMYRRLLSAKDVINFYEGSVAIGFLLMDNNGILRNQTSRASRDLVKECHQENLPCIVEVLPISNNNNDVDHRKLLRNGINEALDMGADAIKLPLNGDIRENCQHIKRAGKHSFVLGGGHLSDETLFVDQMKEAIASGADGLLVGRNISQSKNADLLIKQLLSITHKKDK